RHAERPRTLELERELAAEEALVPDAGEVVSLGEVHDALAGANGVEQHRDLRREDREDLLLVLGERGLGAIEEQQSRGPALVLEQRRRLVLQAIAANLAPLTCR